MKTLSLVFYFTLASTLIAKAFVLNLNVAGNAEHWDLLVPDPAISTNVVNPNTRAIRYFLASDAYSPANIAAELNLVRAAFAQWQSVPDTYVKFEDAGLVDPPVDVNLTDNTNIVYWTKSSTLVNGGMNDITGALGVTFASFTSNENRILQADIVFNAVEYNWFANFFDTTNTNIYVESVALHEIGHFSGLSHSPLGGATMLFQGAPGVNVQTGLSDDDVAATRFLYPTAVASYGAIKGTVTKNGGPVFGAAVFARNPASNTVAGTVTLSDGTFLVGSLPPGNYQIRIAPLDDSGASSFLIRGQNISSDFASADTSFLPSTNKSVSVIAGTTNTSDFVVTDGSPAFRITKISDPTPNPPSSFALGPLPTSMRVGQSNYSIFVASADLPTNNATLNITGDGLTIGPPNFFSQAGLNFIYVSISVSSNATPGLRDFIVQQGGNLAYANGFLEIQPASLDYNFDGLDDAFQRTYFPLFTSAQAAPNADPDGDGLSNTGEYVAGTNPTNAASVLKMLSVSNAPGGAAVRWQSVAGKKYQVSSRTNLVTASWQTNGAPVLGGSSTALYLDATATNGIRFYRVQVLP